MTRLTDTADVAMLVIYAFVVQGLPTAMCPREPTRTSVAGASTLMVKVCVVAAPELSLRRMVKLLVPAVVGVPAINPVGNSESPEGRAPLNRDHVYGGLPSVAFNCCE